MSTPLSDAFAGLLPKEAGQAHSYVIAASTRQPSQLSATAAEWRPPQPAAAAVAAADGQSGQAHNAGGPVAYEDHAWQATYDISTQEVMSNVIGCGCLSAWSIHSALTHHAV